MSRILFVCAMDSCSAIIQTKQWRNDKNARSLSLVFGARPMYTYIFFSSFINIHNAKASTYIANVAIQLVLWANQATKQPSNQPTLHGMVTYFYVFI